MFSLTDETEQTQDTAEDLDNENLHEQIGVRCVRKSRSRACDADANTTEEVARADSETAPEERETYAQRVRERFRAWKGRAPVK